MEPRVVGVEDGDLRLHPLARVGASGDELLEQVAQAPYTVVEVLGHRRGRAAARLLELREQAVDRVQLRARRRLLTHRRFGLVERDAHAASQAVR